MDRLTKSYDTIFTAEDGERAVVAKISTSVVDRDGDVLVPSGLVMTEYMKNPVVLLAHNAGALPIGKVVSYKKQAQDVVAKVQFAERPMEHPPGAEWLADTVLALFRQKILRAFSVGFMIEEARDATEKDAGRFGEGVRRIITRWKMLELSVVPVPANQEALALAVSKSWLADNWGIRKIAQLPLDLPKPLELDSYVPKPLRLDEAA